MIVLAQSLPADDLQVRFKEPYVSKGLNRKSEGVIPAGVFRGFTPSVVALQLTLAADVGTGDSVVVAESINASLTGNFYNTTVRHVGDVVLDLTGVPNGTYFVVLEARYDLTSPTPLTGLTEVRIKLVNGGDLLPQHVILTEVTRAGLLLTLNNALRADTGGPLVTPSQLTTTTLPLMQVFGSATFAGSIGATGGPFVDVPTIPASIAFVLSVAKTVLVMGSANSVTVGEDSSTQFGFSIDAVDTPGSGGGFGLNGANGVYVGAAAYMVPVALAAGPHVVKARWAGTNAGQGCSLNGPTHITVIG